MKKNQYNKDGKPHGYWEAYHSNGKLSSKGNYKDGKLHCYHEFIIPMVKYIIKETIRMIKHMVTRNIIGPIT